MKHLGILRQSILHPSRIIIQQKMQKERIHKHVELWKSMLLDQTCHHLNNHTEKKVSVELLNKPLKKFKGHASPITNIATIDAHRFLSSSWDKTVRLWDVTTGGCLRVFRGHGDWVHAITVINDLYFLSGSDDRTVKLWNVHRGECIRTFVGHASFVKAIAVMEDRETFLSGSRDRTIKLWDVKSGRCIRTYRGHLDTVSTVVCLNSKKFASGSLDSTIKIWSVSGQHVQTLGRHTGEQVEACLLYELTMSP